MLKKGSNYTTSNTPEGSIHLSDALRRLYPHRKCVSPGMPGLAIARKHDLRVTLALPWGKGMRYYVSEESVERAIARINKRMRADADIADDTVSGRFPDLGIRPDGDDTTPSAEAQHALEVAAFQHQIVRLENRVAGLETKIDALLRAWSVEVEV